VLHAAQHVARGLGLAISGCLTKPFRVDGLRGVLREALQRDAAIVPEVTTPPGIEALHASLARREVDVHYQPQVRMSDRHVVGFEALARWRTPEHGDVSPGYFIPLAEEHGALDALTEQVLERAIGDLAMWRGAGIDARLSSTSRRGA